MNGYIYTTKEKDESQRKMRFREKYLKEQFNNIELDNKYILWLDFYALFPYAHESAQVMISIDGKTITHSKSNTHKMYVALPDLKCQTPFPNKLWYAASIGNEGIGVPFIFNNFDELSRVELVTCTWLFTFHNGGVCNKLAIQVIQKTSFVDQPGRLDYVIERKSTSIPQLLENQNNERRMEIISSYAEVIQAKAEIIPGMKKSSPIFTHRIKSESNESDSSMSDVSNRVMEYLRLRAKLQNCKNLFLDIFYDVNTESFQPVDEDVLLYLMGNS